MFGNIYDNTLWIKPLLSIYNYKTYLALYNANNYEQKIVNKFLNYSFHLQKNILITST